jgi:hypothetical protein
MPLHTKSLEDVYIAERFKYRTAEHVAQVNLAIGTVVKP